MIAPTLPNLAWSRQIAPNLEKLPQVLPNLCISCISCQILPTLAETGRIAPIFPNPANCQIFSEIGESCLIFALLAKSCLMLPILPNVDKSPLSCRICRISPYFAKSCQISANVANPRQIPSNLVEACQIFLSQVRSPKPCQFLPNFSKSCPSSQTLARSPQIFPRPSKSYHILPNLAISWQNRQILPFLANGGFLRLRKPRRMGAKFA